MPEHQVTVEWERETPDFAYRTYYRDHDRSFDAGVTVRDSANPAYRGSESCVDPDQLGKVCHPARERVLVFRADDEAAIRARPRKLGYVLPPEV